jgi:hypothetical protein
MTTAEELKPNLLRGPRSYFTDLDPKDQGYNQDEVLRKLKLQLLTKDKIVIAASSLFHNIGLTLFMKDEGLTKCLQRGIIVPAIRNQFNSVDGFFESKQQEGYSPNSKSFFSNHVKQFVSWNLNENTKWFHRTFVNNLRDDNSILRKQTQLPSEQVNAFIQCIEGLLKQRIPNERFLRREDIEVCAKKFGYDIYAYLINFANLIYRLSGARVVNSEGHFPQSNLVKLGIAGNDYLLSDTRVFWELFIEAAISNLSMIAKLTPSRLDSLSIKDVLKIREGLFDYAFSTTFDSLMRQVKDQAEIHDPERLLMKQEEISTISEKLGKILRERISSELKASSIIDKMEGIFQLASVFELFTGGFIIGTVGALKSIPEITSVFSPRLAEAIKSRIETAQRIIYSKTEWHPRQKKALLHGYKALLDFGFPDGI